MTSTNAASSLLRTKSAPAKIQTTDDDAADKPGVTRDNFLTRTILAPILFLSFILSLAIVDRKRSLEQDRQHGVLTKRRRLLYFSLYWKVPRTPKDSLRSVTEPCLGRSGSSHSTVDQDGDSGRRRSSSNSSNSGRRGSGCSEHHVDDDDEGKVMEIKTLAEKQREARSMSAEAFSIQNRVLLGMGVFSIGFGLLCWATYLKVKQLVGFP